MPKSKRNKQIELSKTKKRGLEWKKNLFQEVRSCVDKYENVFIFTVSDMRNSKLKTVREQWKHSRFFFGKNKIMAKALGMFTEDEYMPNLHKIGQQIKGQCGLLFSNKAVEEVLSWFRSYSEGDYARSGNTATETVNLPVGPLDQFPHNLEPYLRQLGLPTSLQKGVIHIVKDHEVCKAGDTLTPETAKVLKLLGYEMAEFHFTINCVWSKDGSSFMQLTESVDTDIKGSKKKKKPSLSSPKVGHTKSTKSENLEEMEVEESSDIQDYVLNSLPETKSSKNKENNEKNCEESSEDSEDETVADLPETKLDNPIKNKEESSDDSEDETVDDLPETKLDNPIKNKEGSSDETVDDLPETKLDNPIKNKEGSSDDSEDETVDDLPETKLDNPIKNNEGSSDDSEDETVDDLPETKLDNPIKNNEGSSDDSQDEAVDNLPETNLDNATKNNENNGKGSYDDFEDMAVDNLPETKLDKSASKNNVMIVREKDNSESNSIVDSSNERHDTSTPKEKNKGFIKDDVSNVQKKNLSHTELNPMEAGDSPVVKETSTKRSHPSADTKTPKFSKTENTREKSLLQTPDANTSQDSPVFRELRSRSVKIVRKRRK